MLDKFNPEVPDINFIKGMMRIYAELAKASPTSQEYHFYLTKLTEWQIKLDICEGEERVENGVVWIPQPISKEPEMTIVSDEVEKNKGLSEEERLKFENDSIENADVISSKPILINEQEIQKRNP
jgi:hypothetical protein